MSDIRTLEQTATQIRRDILRMVHAVNSGHPGGSLGCTDYFVALFFQLMERKDYFEMHGKEEDIFFLSNGHISPVFYATLARAGYFEVSELASFRKLNSRLQGHPTTHDHLPGVRMASGSLGQGLSVAIGAAMAKKYNHDNKIVYVLCGDGELQEGQNWEAILSAPHFKLNNLILTVDVNGQQIDGPTAEVMNLDSLKEKFKAFHWQVIELEEGNNMKAVIDAHKAAKMALQKQAAPVVVLMKTAMGSGVDFMEGTHHWHGVAPNDEQLANALSQLTDTHLQDY